MTEELKTVTAEVIQPEQMSGSMIMNPDAVAKFAEGMAKVRTACLKTTSKGDWSDLDGKPYLEHTGTDKVANLFGVSLKHDSPVKEWKELIEADGTKTAYYTYTTKVTAEFTHPVSGAYIVRDDEGSCSSRDRFFAKRGRKKADGSYEQYFLPVSEVNEADIRKKSMTNADNRVLKKMLGLGGLSWDDLKEFGITSEGVKAVTYSKGKKGGATTATTADKADLKNQIQEIVWAYTEGEGPEKNTNYKANLKGLTYWEGQDGDVKSPGVESLSDLPDWRTPTILGMAKTAYKNKTGQEWAK